MHELGADITSLIRENAGLAVPLTFLVAFCESVALVSFLVPATVILLGLGAIVCAGAVESLPVWAAAAAGAVAGDVISSYWLG